MSAHRVPRGAMAAAAIVLAACRSSEAAHTPPTSSADVNVVTVTASDYHFEAPPETPAGLTTFRLVNRGPSLHHVQLIKLDQGKTTDDFLAALKAGGPPPQWATPAGGPNPPEPGSTASATVLLEPGNYALICFIPAEDGMPHVMKGMASTLKVTPATRPAAAEPAADIVVKLVDYDFELSAPLTAGRHTLRVENAAGQPHEIALIRLKEGKGPMDFAAWGEKPTGPAPGSLFGGVSGIMPGAHAFATVDLPPGDYALMCFVPDMKDGKPHFVHGMAKRIKVI
jgi:hypothetical protein